MTETTCSPQVNAPDNDYYRTADPFFFLRAAVAVQESQKKRPNIQFVDAETDKSVSHSIVDEFWRNYDNSLQVFMHSLRLQQAEAALLLLCAGYPHDPFYRFTRRTRYDEWNMILDDLSKRAAPKELPVSINGRILEFSEWVGYKIYQRSRMNEEPDWIDSVATYVSEEANLIKSREVANAVKHGARLSSGSAKLQVKLESGDWSELLSANGIRWGSWDGRSETYIFGVKQIDCSVDFARVFYGALFCNMIVQCRRANLEGRPLKDISCPTYLAEDSPSSVNKIVMRVAFHSR